MINRQQKLETGELEDQRESIGRRRFDRALPAITFAMAVLAVVAIVVAIGASHAASDAATATQKAEKLLSKLEKDQGGLYRAELRACQRVQGLREEMNVVTDIIYRVLVARTQQTDDPMTNTFFEFLSKQLAYQPPSDCPNAVADQEYIRPNEIPWSQIRGSKVSGLKGRIGVP